MNSQLENIEFYFPDKFNQDDFIQLLPEEPFSENAISFLNALSNVLRNNPECDNFPEIITFAFFCRQANIIQLKKIYYPENNKRTGRGVVFHISPSNMPMNFAYSLVSGILSGNTNIVRLPSKKFTQVDMVLKAIKSLGDKQEFLSFTKRMLLVRYDKMNSATSYFSSVCNARIIWGGDSAISEIKKNKLPAKAIDLTFGDKYSICLINANQFIHEVFPEKTVQSFYNDTFLFDQNACTSPHLIVWFGSNENIKNSKQIFWDNLYDLVEKKYHFQAHSVIDKLNTFYNQAIQMDGIKKVTMPDNLIWRVELQELPEDVDKHRCHCGYFVEYTAESLSELSGIISKKYQTIACYGFEKKDWSGFNIKNDLNVSDRLKPIGKTSDFSLTWDGYNLIDTLSREQ
ncbi:MAG: acyl-CoA reductase [Bacteroidetes bacterium]|jgi:hypothetical protein|nr:acyl-CoA reductase [Bacteroidota bacterium]